MNTIRTIRPAAALAAAVALALAGCTSGAADDAPAASHSTHISGATLIVTDGWAKAAESGMTAAFGVLENTSDQDVTVISATSTAASAVELHETVVGGDGSMTMREREGGFPLPSLGTFALEPGGSHLMLMGLTRPLRAGDELEITIELSNGETHDLRLPVKDFAGANETYEGSGGADHGDMPHGEH